MKTEAHERGQHATATAYIFEVRAKRLRKYLNRLTFVGVAVPAIVGALALAYGANFGPLDVIVPVAAGIGGLQLIFFVWSVVAQWVDRYEQAVQAVVANRDLALRFGSLGKQPAANAASFRHELDVLKAIDASQAQFDYRQGVTDAEKRMGMRALLRQYQRECAKCGEIPATMKPTECGICGDYPARWVRR